MRSRLSAFPAWFAALYINMEEQYGGGQFQQPNPPGRMKYLVSLRPPNGRSLALLHYGASPQEREEQERTNFIFSFLGISFFVGTVKNATILLKCMSGSLWTAMGENLQVMRNNGLQNGTLRAATLPQLDRRGMNVILYNRNEETEDAWGIVVCLSHSQWRRWRDSHGNRGRET